MQELGRASQGTCGAGGKAVALFLPGGSLWGAEQRGGTDTSVDSLVVDKDSTSSCVDGNSQGERRSRGTALSPSHCFRAPGPRGAAALEAMGEVAVCVVIPAGVRPCSALLALCSRASLFTSLCLCFPTSNVKKMPPPP